MQYACFFIKVYTLKVEMSVEKNVQVNSTIANHTLLGEKNVQNVLLIYLWKACSVTIWFGQ